MDQNKKLFPQRLWELVHDEKYDFCLRWSPDGQKIYLNRNEFETHYLRTPSNQFHTKKAISFVRQMNMYGFRKVDDCYYENDNFKRNCHHLLKNMIRRHSNKPNHQNISTSTSLGNLVLGCSMNNGNDFRNSNRADVIVSGSNMHETAPSGMIDTIAGNNTSGSSSPRRNHREQLGQQDQPLNATFQSFYRQFTGINSAALNSMTSSSSNHQVLPYLNNDASNSEQMSSIAPPMPKVAHVTDVSPSLNSTLYQRLAALNFGLSQSNLFQEQIERTQQLSQLDEQSFQKIYSLSEQSRNALGSSTSTIDLAQQMSLGIQQAPQLESLNLTIDQQQSLLARQALLQQTLFGSLLSLRTSPQVLNSAILDDNLLATLRQQSAMSSQTLFDVANRPTESEPMVTTESPQDDPADAPLELVVDSPRSSSSSNRHSLDRQLSSSNLSTQGRGIDFIFNMTSQSSNSNPSRWNSPGQRDDDFVDDEDSFCSNNEDTYDTSSNHV